ncbi:DUF5317 domain-containing protein [Candidatus Aerophobetes bacterium]|nr:DUF5317 domain-containing protein [Candidatus Aerophobetes bacterium]
MLLDVLVISLVVSFLKGGKVGRLAEIEFRKIWLIICPFLLQYVLFLSGEKSFPIFEKWGNYLYLLSYMLLLVGIWVNRNIKGMKILGCGALLNFLVIVANRGHMPVSLRALEKAGLTDMMVFLKSKSYIMHTILSENTKLKFLADVIPLPPPYPRPRVVSVGDIIMGGGLFWLVQSYTKRKQKKGED